MKTRTILGYAALALSAAFIPARAATPAEELLCGTSDGPVRITAASVSLRDYMFTIDRVVGDGVVMLRDVRTGAVAELDARNEDGVYLAITEGGVSMQVVAPRANMKVREAREQAPAAAPSIGLASDGVSPAAGQQVNLRKVVTTQY